MSPRIEAACPVTTATEALRVVGITAVLKDLFGTDDGPACREMAGLISDLSDEQVLTHLAAIHHVRRTKEFGLANRLTGFFEDFT